ncbi:ribosome-associated ATPase/putative transporter RbbA [Thalassobaculum sp. OXR-137]|uniref:ribosome-associated ATPase/putative transporter RbbA n=1 Tax=Thalassobaculum sp. OXR-137 TaxID=3100173 RepID=UPI002AC8966D|nr:ribosome-associated ATPase/putative transporter RbbA [Thalassobaculum sp. OXR-137]WPZ34030.1 ribosome-associated ATPase/putative transporter RbbA [Thalassobaculum sp. OXR-137]
MSADPEPCIRLEGVRHRYGTTEALADISLSLMPGRTLGLIGPDGVGKSTLLGLIAGIRRSQQGTVTVLGADMTQAGGRADVCGRIAYMPQGLGRNLYSTLSVAENVDFFARLYGQPPQERERRIDDLLQATGIADFRDRPAGKLSGGMKQKLALCCALVHDPDLMILDEPTTGIDPLSRVQFWRLIDRIRARRPGMTLVVATAQMSEAEMFDTILALDRGRAIARSSVSEILARTGTATLDDAFLALLPEATSGRDGAVSPPRPSTAGPPAIEAEGLVKRFGDFTAVDGVSFRIEAGEIFGFLGSNGCGKTTTMKMLTGLLAPTEGEARLFGTPVSVQSGAMKQRVGYMSQSFSLYGELSTRQNLEMHADLFGLSPDRKRHRVAELLEQFDLATVAGSRPDRLPVGVRQRLQLAVAVLHEPDMLILDEPTSGVDPIARDRFWELLYDLSRKRGVTIFISTHLMEEVTRCDRVSLMHAGRVLAVGTPEALRQRQEAPTIEAAFIRYLEQAAGDGDDPAPAHPVPVAAAPPAEANKADRPAGYFSLRRCWAFARREALELLRDRILLTFALLGPLILMLAMGYGVSFDVDSLTYAALDQDRSPESRMVLRQLSSSPYFEEGPELADFADLDRQMGAGRIALALVVPPGFGRDLLAGHTPEVAAWLDGANTIRAETIRGYVEAAFQGFLAELVLTETGAPAPRAPVTVETRFRYNQAFRSTDAISPGVLMMLLMMIPAMLTALGVVREKELGSITNFYAAPVRRLEFLIGKQLPYIAVAMVSLASLVALMRSLFGVPFAGSPIALLVGAALYTTAATAFGLVVSTFVRSQIAAIFATAIIVMIPAVNFSGMMYPASGLEGAARVIGHAFPSLYFQNIATGVFNKGLDLGQLYRNHAILAAFVVAYWCAASVLLRKQED